MTKLYKIKFIKDTELKKAGEIGEATKKNADAFVSNGYAEYFNGVDLVEEIEKVKKETKKKNKTVKSVKSVEEKPLPDWVNAEKELKELVGKGWGEQEQGKEEIIEKYNVTKTKLDKLLQSLETARKKEEREKQRNAEMQLYLKQKEIKEAERREREAEKQANKEVKELQLKELQSTYKTCDYELFKLVYVDYSTIAMDLMAERVLSDNIYDDGEGNKFQGIKTFEDNGEMIAYNPVTGIHEQNQEIEIAKLIQSKLGEMAIDYVVKEITNKIRRSTYIDRNIIEEQPKHLKPVQNGLYNIETNNLEKFNPKYIFLTRTNKLYNPNACYKKFLKFLHSVLETKEDVLAMQEWFGYLLLNDCRFQKACLLFGSGANGKSVLLKIIKRFIGSEYCTSIALQYLETNSFALARLFGKTANIFFDLPKKALSQTSNFKMIVAGDSLTAEKKGKDSFEFTPFVKEMFSCNEVPRTPDTSPAFFRRWKIFKFSKTFEEGNPERIENLEEQFYKKEEMEGILLFSIEGLKRLIQQKKFTENMTRAEVEEFWIKHSDSVLSFIMDLVEVDVTAETPKQEFFDKYEEYCKSKEYVPENYQNFFRRLKDKIEYEEAKPKAEFGISRQRMIKGIRIKEVPVTTI